MDIRTSTVFDIPLMNGSFDYYFVNKPSLYIQTIAYICIHNFAAVVELVDTLDLGSSAERCGGSTPFSRTKKTSQKY